MTSYAAHPQAWERDPIITPGAHGRADVPSGPMSKWLRFNSAEDLVWVTDAFGKPRALTRKQLAVYNVIREIAGTGTRVTMRDVGARLSVAASTVYRAVIKLASFGLVAYQSNRGRLGGYVFLTEHVDWVTDHAKALVRKWYKASEERISRLRRNVASCFPGRERELYQYQEPVTVQAATFRPWTPDDFREAGLM